MHHPCTIIYSLSNKPVYGNEKGTCRITGQQSTGIKFSKWIKDTFTDIGFLRPGNIISNEAAFCFEEQSEYLQQQCSGLLNRQVRYKKSAGMGAFLTYNSV